MFLVTWSYAHTFGTQGMCPLLTVVHVNIFKCTTDQLGYFKWVEMCTLSV